MEENMKEWLRGFDKTNDVSCYIDCRLAKAVDKELFKLYILVILVANTYSCIMPKHGRVSPLGHHLSFSPPTHCKIH